jgi:lysophospholipase L1-like esterase
LGGATAVVASTISTTGGSQGAGGGSTLGTTASGGVGSGGKSSSGGTSSAGGATAKGGTSSSGGTTAKGGTSSAGGTSTVTTTLPAVTVYLAGDSTVCNYNLSTPKDESNKEQAGWGQMLAEYFGTKVTVSNYASGGQTALSFMTTASKLDSILSKIQPGDYLLIQFGTNDSNSSATAYYATVEAFTGYLTTYITKTRAKGAIPVLVTPPPRNSAYCTGSGSTMTNYAKAMVTLGAAQNVAVVGLMAKTAAYLKAICPAPASTAEETFFKINGTAIDGTHFQEHGARIMAGFVADGISEAGLGLASYLL